MISQANLSCIITNFLNHFILPKPLPIFYNASKEKKISLAKSMNENGISLRWVEESISSEKFLLILYSDDSIQSENIKINQQFYFFSKSMELFEKYAVNNHVIEQKLGYVSNNSYFPTEFVEQSFLRRRKNFHGLEMLAMTAEIENALMFKNLDQAKYFPSNQTKDVTKLVKGSLYDIWTHLENTLNFSTKMYRR